MIWYRNTYRQLSYWPKFIQIGQSVFWPKVACVVVTKRLTLTGVTVEVYSEFTKLISGNQSLFGMAKCSIWRGNEIHNANLGIVRKLVRIAEDRLE